MLYIFSGARDTFGCYYYAQVTGPTIYLSLSVILKEVITLPEKSYFTGVIVERERKKTRLTWKKDCSFFKSSPSTSKLINNEKKNPKAEMRLESTGEVAVVVQRSVARSGRANYPVKANYTLKTSLIQLTLN